MYRLKALSSSSSSEAVPLLTQAIKSLHDALAVKPDDGTSLVFLAVLYGDLQQPQQALDTLAKVPSGSVPDFMAGTVDSFRTQMQAMLAAGSTTTTA
jgi:cytochrome c-type biogenesis protein CcmH/NrfG